MEMSSNEQALFNHVKDAKDDNGEPMFKKIILCINTADPFEVARYQDDERVQGVIWMGFLGGMGLKALPYIITGESQSRPLILWTYGRQVSEKILRGLTSVRISR